MGRSLNEEGLGEAVCFQDRVLFPFRFANCCSERRPQTKGELCVGRPPGGTNVYFIQQQEHTPLFDFLRAAS